MLPPDPTVLANPSPSAGSMIIVIKLCGSGLFRTFGAG
jgi:hypothetical protein